MKAKRTGTFQAKGKLLEN